MNVPLTAGTGTLEEVAIATLEARFMAGPLATIDEGVLSRWQPRPMGWFLRLQQLLAQRAGLRSYYCDIDEHRINYWAGGKPRSSDTVVTAWLRFQPRKLVNHGSVAG